MDVDIFFNICRYLAVSENGKLMIQQWIEWATLFSEKPHGWK